MQIHLFDSKSTIALRRGLASNKLNLCMLVLSKLRETYWSASVIYRLFERAQLILTNSKANTRNNTEKSRANPHRTGPLSDSQDVADYEYHQQQQYQGDVEESMLPTPEAAFLMNQQAALPWLNDSPCFSNVDQLLSPGFSLSETVFQSLFTGYNDSPIGVYDQVVPMLNNVPSDLHYNE